MAMEFTDVGKPIMMMLVGIAGSGKSTIAKHIVSQYENKYGVGAACIPVIHSSDDLREELFGDANDQSRNNELFTELHRRIKRDLMQGRNIIYDATNINKKRRIAFLRELTHISCFKHCIVVMKTIEECKINNAKRERVVPDKVIDKMYKNWQPPHKSEGFDKIDISENRYFPRFFEGQNGDKTAILSGEQNGGLPNIHEYVLLHDTMMAFDQENAHHSLTLGEHCDKAMLFCKNAAPENYLLQIAAAIHDIGKLYTKTRMNSRGVYDGNCHYYQHQCVGAYEAVLLLCHIGFPVDDILYISNLIYYHMHPFMSWKDSTDSMVRDNKLIGDKMFNDIVILHEADLFAH